MNAVLVARGSLRRRGDDGTEADIRIQSSQAICSQIARLSFDAGCPSEAEASSSPCHQRRLWLRSYEGWWRVMYEGREAATASGLSRTTWPTLAQHQAASSTDAGALASAQKERTCKSFSRVRVCCPQFLVLLLKRINSLRILVGHYVFS